MKFEDIGKLDPKVIKNSMNGILPITGKQVLYAKKLGIVKTNEEFVSMSREELSKEINEKFDKLEKINLDYYAIPDSGQVDTFDGVDKAIWYDKDDGKGEG